MNKRNFLSGRDKELFDLAEKYEKAQQEGKHIYMDADDWADMADWCAMNNKREIAYQAVESGLTQHPENTALLIEKAYLNLDDKQLEKAIEIADTIEDTELDEVKILKASLHLNQGEDWKAQELLDSLESNDALGNIIEVAYMYIDAGMPEQALPWLENGKQYYMKDEAFLTVLADYYAAINDLEQAIGLFNQLIDINPYSAPYWFALSRCYLLTEQYHKAIEAAEFAIVSDEEFGEAYMILANSYFFLNNEEKGMEYFELAKKYMPITESFDQTMEAMHLFDDGDWEEAHEAFLEALENEDIHTDYGQSQANILYSYLAMCQIRMGHNDQAEEYCKKGMAIAPNQPESFIAYGYLLIENGHEEKGISQWRKADAISPTSTTWWQIASYALEFKMLEFALEYFKKINKENPNFPMLQEQLAMTYLLLDDLENFKKHNQLCEHPLNVEKIDAVRKAMANIKDCNLADIILQAINALKRGNS